MKTLAPAALVLALGCWAAAPAAGQPVPSPSRLEMRAAPVPAGPLVSAGSVVRQGDVTSSSRVATEGTAAGDSVASVGRGMQVYLVERLPGLRATHENPSWEGAVGAFVVVHQEPASTARLVTAGAAGAAVGSLAGAWLGYHLDREVFQWDGGDDPGSVGAIGGWFIGSALLTPLAVHLANGRRGSLGASYRAAALIAGAGLVGTLATGSPVGIVFIVGAPIAQVVSATRIERRGDR